MINLKKLENLRLEVLDNLRVVDYQLDLMKDNDTATATISTELRLTAEAEELENLADSILDYLTYKKPNKPLKFSEVRRQYAFNARLRSYG